MLYNSLFSGMGTELGISDSNSAIELGFLLCSPMLNWRDVQHLLVKTSRSVHLRAPDWRTNGAGRKGQRSQRISSTRHYVNFILSSTHELLGLLSPLPHIISAWFLLNSFDPIKCNMIHIFSVRIFSIIHNCEPVFMLHKLQLIKH